MPEYEPSPTEWVRKQVELIESTGGREGMTMRDMAVVLVTHKGRNSGAIRKTPLMRVVDGDNYLLVASIGGAPKHPVWYYNLVTDPDITVRDGTNLQGMRARLVTDPATALASGRSRSRLSPTMPSTGPRQRA